MNKPYYPLYTGDFLKETTMLDAEKIGFLILIIMAAWNNSSQGFIECSWTDLKFICHAENIEHVKQNVSKIKAKKILCIEFVHQNTDPDLEIVRVVYPPMVHQFHVSQVRAEAGSAGGKESSKKKSLNKKGRAKSKQTNGIDIGNANDFETVLEEDSLKGETINPFSDFFLQHWADWKEYKLSEHKFKYKSLKSEQAALDQLCGFAESAEDTAIKIIQQSKANGWKGFFPLNSQSNEKKNGHSKTAGAGQLSELLQRQFANSEQ
jgi:hypothetical protein